MSCPVTLPKAKELQVKIIEIETFRVEPVYMWVCSAVLSHVSQCAGYFHQKMGDDEALSTCCTGLLQWVRHTSKFAKDFPNAAADSQDSKLSFERLVSLSKLCSDLVADCVLRHPDPPASKEGVEPDPMVVLACETMDQVWKMVQRLEKLIIARAVIDLANGKLQGKSYQDVFPSELHPVAHALQTSWKAEVDGIKDIELKAYFPKIGLCESAIMTVNLPLLQDPTFETVRNECKEFARAFVAGLRAAVEDGSAAFALPLNSFQLKYAAVMPAVEKWTLDDVRWIFTPDHSEDVKKDMKDLRNAKTDASAFASDVGSLLQFKSTATTPMLGEVLTAAEKVKKDLMNKISEVSALATVMVFTDVALDKETNLEIMDNSEKYTQKHFGLGKNNLPDKLTEMLKTIKPAKKDKEKEKKDKKADKKEKDKEKDKGADDKEKKRKGRQSTGSEKKSRK